MAVEPEPIEGLCLLNPLTPIQYFCAACGQPNDADVDLLGGFRQQLVEDCEVCCRPNTLSVHVDPDSGKATVISESE